MNNLSIFSDEELYNELQTRRVLNDKRIFIEGTALNTSPLEVKLESSGLILFRHGLSVWKLSKEDRHALSILLSESQKSED